MMSTPQQPGPAPAINWRVNAYALAVGNLLYAAGFTVFYPYVSLIVRELGVTEHLETWVGYIAGGIFLLTFVLTPLWGSLADHFGKKSMVLRAGLGIGFAFLALGYAPSLGWFMALVYLIGLFNGFVASAMALCAANTPPAFMGRALGIVQSGAHLGTTLGPVFGAVLATVLAAYQDMFFISAGMCLAGGLTVLFLAREIHQKPTERLALHPLRDLIRFLRIPNMAVLYLLNFIFSAVFFGNITVMAIYVLELMQGAPEYMGFSVAAWVGIVNVGLTIGSAVALPVWGRLLDRFQPGWMLALGLVLALLCAGPVPWLTNPLQLAGMRCALGLLGAGIMPAVVQMTKERAPEGMDARALSFGTSLYMLGHGGAPMMAGLVGPVLGLRAYFALNTLFLVAGLALWLASFAWQRARRT